MVFEIEANVKMLTDEQTYRQMDLSIHKLLVQSDKKKQISVEAQFCTFINTSYRMCVIFKKIILIKQTVPCSTAYIIQNF